MYALCFVFITISSFAASIYGEDNRVDYFEIQDNKIKALTSSIATRIASQDIRVAESTYKLKSQRFGFKHMLCEREKFYNQNLAGDCTGFLITESKILTAGHCVQNRADCKNSYWLFDYKMMSEKSNLLNGSTENLFRCKKILYKSKSNSEVDLAIIKLDRSTKREPLTLSNNKAQQRQELFVMGYPKGLPLKYADGAKVQQLNKTTFFADLDTYSGNSGSPVFDLRSLEVVGVLTSGKMDFMAKRDYGSEQCQFSAVYKANLKSSETINYIQNITKYLK